jgi:hypothetical protein
MMAEREKPDELSPDEIAAELRAAGVALTSQSL